MATAAAVEGPAARFAKDHLKAFVERVERLEEEKKAIADDIRDVYAEAKANGFDVKALRTIVRLRKQDADERREQEAILETYLYALGLTIMARIHGSLKRSPTRTTLGPLDGATEGWSSLRLTAIVVSGAAGATRGVSGSVGSARATAMGVGCAA